MGRYLEFAQNKNGEKENKSELLNLLYRSFSVEDTEIGSIINRFDYDRAPITKGMTRTEV